MLSAADHDTDFSRFALDPHADGGHRKISVGAETVLIERSVKGVRMRIAIPFGFFAGVALSSIQRCGRPLYRLVLSHRDPELCVVLSETYDAVQVRLQWQNWVRRINRPALFDAGQGPAQAAPQIFPVGQRLYEVAKRRPLRARRRKTGRPDRMAIVLRGEREIICYE